jgi:hypothetical protein
MELILKGKNSDFKATGCKGPREICHEIYQNNEAFKED